MISIVLGTYNRINKLKKCLESIAPSMSELNIEVLISDGGSIDGTIDFIRSKPYNLNIKFTIDNCLFGVTYVYNNMFRCAKYPVLTWISDDSTYEPEAICSLYN